MIHAARLSDVQWLESLYIRVEPRFPLWDDKYGADINPIRGRRSEPQRSLPVLSEGHRNFQHFQVGSSSSSIIIHSSFWRELSDWHLHNGAVHFVLFPSYGHGRREFILKTVKKKIEVNTLLITVVCRNPVSGQIEPVCALRRISPHELRHPAMTKSIPDLKIRTFPMRFQCGIN